MAGRCRMLEEVWRGCEYDDLYSIIETFSTHSIHECYELFGHYMAGIWYNSRM